MHRAGSPQVSAPRRLALCERPFSDLREEGQNAVGVTFGEMIGSSS
jgi:hypothetical protein